VLSEACFEQDFLGRNRFAEVHRFRDIEALTADGKREIA
jgi:hypothetical protein